MVRSYDPDACDLCGAEASRTVVEIRMGRGMTSDARVSRRELKKVQCLECGLIRDGLRFRADEIERYYAKSYQLNARKHQDEHVFFTPDGPVPRSAAVRDWMLELRPPHEWPDGSRVLEVGCGQGNLLMRLRESCPQVTYQGVDMSEEAVLLARQKGLDVVRGGIDSAPSKQYDLAIAFGVLEHVTSPTELLSAIESRLAPGGQTLIGVPAQGTRTYDVFIVDHLHHFTSLHVNAFAQKVGLSHVRTSMTHALVHNFGLHLFSKGPGSVPQPGSFEGLPTQWEAQESAAALQGHFREVDRRLRQNAGAKRIAVFGVGEVFCLLYTYTHLGEITIACGLDDDEGRQQNSPWPFPVVSPERAREFGVELVYLCMNPVYHDAVISRLGKLGLPSEPLFCEMAPSGSGSGCDQEADGTGAERE